MKLSFDLIKFLEQFETADRVTGLQKLLSALGMRATVFYWDDHITARVRGMRDRILVSLWLCAARGNKQASISIVEPKWYQNWTRKVTVHDMRGEKGKEYVEKLTRISFR
jgi:hypothetical protein